MTQRGEMNKIHLIMLNATTLNLIENEEKTREIISEYFGQYDISKWKYEDAVKTLIDANFVMRLTKKKTWRN